MTDCKHELSRGIWRFEPTRYYSFCIKCKMKWFDDGKRWENDPIAQSKVKKWEARTK